MDTSSLYPGRILYAKTKNRATSEIRNIFSFYGRANGSNEERTILIDIIKNKISSDSLDNVYVLGDFNFVTSTLDRNSNIYTAADKVCKSTWDTFESTVNICDSFRMLYKNRRLYSWSNSRHSKSRIDRIYVPGDCVGKLDVLNFENSQCSDHKLLRLRVVDSIDRGPGVWVFNNSLLKDERFVTYMKDTIIEFRDNAIGVPNKKVYWDFLKMAMSSAAKE